MSARRYARGAEKMKRYEVITGTNFGNEVDAQECPDGEWCKYDDVSPLLDEIEDLKRQLDEARFAHLKSVIDRLTK